MLVNAIHYGAEVPVAVFGDVEDDVKLHRAGIEQTLPIASDILALHKARATEKSGGRNDRPDISS